MSDFRDNILGRAFQVVPGGEFNRARRELLERADIAPVVYEVPAEVKEKLEIRTAETVDEVLAAALEKSASTKSAS